MKRIIAILAVALVGLAACTKLGNDGTVTPGLYTYDAGTFFVAVCTVDKDGWSAQTYCEAGYINVMDKQTGASIFAQTQGIETFQQDGCTGWTYSNGLRILCVPKDRRSFTGQVLSQPTGWTLPGSVVFWLQSER